MATSRQLFTYSGFSTKLTKNVVCKCQNYWSRSNRARHLSFLASQWFALARQTQSPGHGKSISYSNSVHLRLSYSVPEILSSRYNVKPVIGRFNRTMKTTSTDDQEFVSQSISIPPDCEPFDMIKKINEKIGVLAKVSRETEEDERQWAILLGGTRQEVQNAVSFLRTLLNTQKQRLTSSTQLGKKRELADKEKPIWAFYRRNFKGQKPPMKTRKRCIRGAGEKQTVSGNPCPLCRLYLAGGYELDYTDIDLLIQFISPHTGEVFEAPKTGLCRVQQEKMVKAIETAKNYGLLPYSIPGPRSLVEPPKVAKIPRNVRLK